MAEEAGVSEADLRKKLIELLQATYVDIEDMSGALLCPTIPLHALTVQQAAVAKHTLR